MEITIERDDYWKIAGVTGAVLVVAMAVFLFMGGGGDKPVTAPPEKTSGTDTRGGGFNIDKGEYTEDAIYTVIYKGQPQWNMTTPKIRTNEQIDPENEYWNVYMTGYITKENGSDVFKADIYVDEAFRSAVQPLTIAWGTGMDKSRPYKPEEVRDGVYKDTITDTNVSRFKDVGPHSDEEVNIAIGNFTQGERKHRSKYTIVLLQ